MNPSFEKPPTLPKYKVGQVVYAKIINGNGSTQNYAVSILAIKWWQKRGEYDESGWLYMIPKDSYRVSIKESEILEVLS